MDEEAKRIKREQAEARRRRILERGRARFNAITGEKGAAGQDESRSIASSPEVPAAPMSQMPPPTNPPSRPNLPPPSKEESHSPSQPEHESLPDSQENLSPSPDIVLKSKLKNLVINSPDDGGEGGARFAMPSIASFRTVGLVFDFTRVFQILTAIVLGIAAALGVDYGMSPLLGLLFAEAMVVGGGWCVIAMNPYYLEDLLQRRRALNQIAMKEGSGIIPSVLYSIPSLREMLTTAADLGCVAKSLSEDVSVFVVVAGVVAEFNGIR